MNEDGKKRGDGDAPAEPPAYERPSEPNAAATLRRFWLLPRLVRAFDRSLSRLHDHLSGAAAYGLRRPDGTPHVEIHDAVRMLYFEAIRHCNAGKASAGWKAYKQARRLSLAASPVERLVATALGEKGRIENDLPEGKREAAIKALQPLLNKIERKPDSVKTEEVAATLAYVIELRDSHVDDRHASREDNALRLWALGAFLIIAIIPFMYLFSCHFSDGKFEFYFGLVAAGLAGCIGACVSGSRALIAGDDTPTIFTSISTTTFRPILGFAAGVFTLIGINFLGIDLGDNGVSSENSEGVTLDTLFITFASGFSERVLIPLMRSSDPNGENSRQGQNGRPDASS